MIAAIARKVFGTQNERELKTILPIVQKINELESSISALSDEQLAAQTIRFRERLAKGETLDSLIPEAFATVRETGKRILGMRHYDVQMIGGVTLHRGRIAEMKTGEGKTLVATLPVYLNALTGKGVHVVTVNDYLAKRDSEWMGRIYRFLGMSVGIIVHGLSDRERKTNYACDITYGTNNEYGFDYLRDNMKFRLEDYVQREHNFAIVDEVDSILVDEARTPLIISGPTDETTDKYYIIDKLVKRLEKDKHFTVDEKHRSAQMTDAGVEEMERLLGIPNMYDPEHMSTVHHVTQAVKAHALFKNDVDYVVKEGEVVIVDEFTGRLMPGRRWSDGLHQAVEAKEGLKIENENQTLASITFQNYFRLYKKLGGMTGTADTEAVEFKKIYNLDVSVIPTNKHNIRVDEKDVIYKSEEKKFAAVVGQIKILHEKGQPVLVGTVSVENSEKLSHHLKNAGISHNVLNAKNHFREAEIVAQAGRLKSVTIATNMAGRGTDILLGGNHEFLAKTVANPELDPEGYKSALEKYKKICSDEHKQVKELGGLFVIGTERHESRRIDNQLRGRCARQGDPGCSKFYLSLDDNLLRIFGGDRILKFVKMEEDEVIEHKWIDRAIESAQKKVEAHNFEIRKHLLDYDDVVNQQRKLIYGLRREVLEGGPTCREVIVSMIDELASLSVEAVPLGSDMSKWDFKEINQAVKTSFIVLPELTSKGLVKADRQGLVNLISSKAKAYYQEKEAKYGEELMRQLERMLLLQSIDLLWKDHLLSLDHLREGIGLRGYGQKDPLVEYKKESFALFSNLNRTLTADVVAKVFTVEVRPEVLAESAHDQKAEVLAQEEPTAPQPVLREINRGSSQMTMKRGDDVIDSAMSASSSGGDKSDKVGPNEPCPCGSGKKYKKCHGQDR